MNGFVNTVGKHDLLGRNSKMSRHYAFHGLAFGISSKFAGRDATESFLYFRRARNRVLIEVEAQGISISKRRMIFLHCLNASPRNRKAQIGLIHGPSLFAFDSRSPFVQLYEYAS